MLYINTHDWSKFKKLKIDKIKFIVPSESNDDLLEGQTEIFVHTAIFPNRKVLYMYICLIFSPVFLNPPCRMLKFQHVTRISLLQTINGTLRRGLNSFDKDCFSDFCTCWTKKITTPVWWLQCCTISVLN